MAGGSGSRMASKLPKQFLLLSGRPILMHTLEAFHQYDAQLKLFVVLPSNQLDYWNQLCQEHRFEVPHQVVVGGHERFFSVKNGLQAVAAVRGQGFSADLIAVHDAVRPFVGKELLDRCFQAVSEKTAIVPVFPIVESLRRCVPGQPSQAEDRRQFFAVQTPQVFQADCLLKAYQQDYCPIFTDDASVVEAAGTEIHTVEGIRQNIKITTADDLGIADYWISQS